MTGLDNIDFNVVIPVPCTPRAAGHVGTVHCSITDISQRQAFNYPLALQNHEGWLIIASIHWYFWCLREFTLKMFSKKESFLCFNFSLHHHQEPKEVTMSVCLSLRWEERILIYVERAALLFWFNFSSTRHWILIYAPILILNIFAKNKHLNREKNQVMIRLIFLSKKGNRHSHSHSRKIA